MKKDICATEAGDTEKVNVLNIKEKPNFRIVRKVFAVRALILLCQHFSVSSVSP